MSLFKKRFPTLEEQISRLSPKCRELTDEESRLVNGGGPSVWDTYNGTGCPYEYTTIPKGPPAETTTPASNTPASKTSEIPESTATDTSNQTPEQSTSNTTYLPTAASTPDYILLVERYVNQLREKGKLSENLCEEIQEMLKKRIANDNKLRESIISSIEVKSVSEEGINFIKEYEGFKSNAYRIGQGNYTIGYGHEIRPGENYKSLTVEEADSLLRKDLEWYSEGIVRNYEGLIPLTQYEFDALVSLEYNIGRDELVQPRKSGILQDIASGADIEKITSKISSYVYDKLGNYYSGLETRRIDELELFIYADYMINRDFSIDKPF